MPYRSEGAPLLPGLHRLYTVGGGAQVEGGHLLTNDALIEQS